MRGSTSGEANFMRLRPNTPIMVNWYMRRDTMVQRNTTGHWRRRRRRRSKGGRGLGGEEEEKEEEEKEEE